MKLVLHADKPKPVAHSYLWQSSFWTVNVHCTVCYLQLTTTVYVASSVLIGLLILQEYSPLSFLFRLIKDSTLLLSWSIMLSVRVRFEPSFTHFLVKTVPAASQVRLTELPSIGMFVDDLTEAPDILSVEQNITEFVWKQEQLTANIITTAPWNMCRICQVTH